MTPATPQPPRRFGEFELLAPLSRGGMGEVYLARQHGAQGFRRFVALKLMRLDIETDKNTRKLFFDEAQLLGRIAHPAVAQVFGFGEEAENLYLAMEYVAGVSFSALRKLPMGSVPPEVAAALVGAAARGLHAAHELKDLDGRLLDVVHRDVSPQNLMVTFDGQVKVLDFGIALHRERTSQATTLGSVRGKAAYISPEVLLGDPPTRQCDVWALGVVLHELLTGHPLFSRDQDLASMHAVLHGEIPPPHEVAPSVPLALSRVTMQALARPLEERFSTAAVLADALEAIAREHFASPEKWARTALEDRRTTQERWLADSARLGPAQFAPAVAPQKATADAPTQSVRVELAPTKASRPKKAGRRWWEAVLLLIVVGTCGGGLGVALRSPSALREDAVDAGLPLPLPVALVTPVDAGPQQGEEDAGEVAQVASPVSAPDAGRAVAVRAITKRPKVTSWVDAGPAVERIAAPLQQVPLQVTTSTAWGTVRIDGQVIGPTPLFRDRNRITVGAHLIELIAPDTLEVRALRNVTVQPGESVTINFQ